MMKKRSMVALLSLIGLLMPVAAAQAQAESLTNQTRAALARIADGTYTVSDLELVKSQPEVAAQVPDPTRPEQVDATAGPSVAGLTALSSTCKWYQVSYSKYSLSGSTIYTWAHRLSACYNGSTVTSYYDRYDWLPNQQGIIYVRELTGNSISGVNTTLLTSFMQRHLEYCVAKYGCYANTYPWARIKIDYAGRWNYDGSAG